MATVTQPVVTHISGFWVDVEYDSITNAIAAIIVNNPNGQDATFSLIAPLIGATALDTGVGSDRRILIAPGAVWSDNSGALSWPGGWGYEMSVS